MFIRSHICKIFQSFRKNKRTSGIMTGHWHWLPRLELFLQCVRLHILVPSLCSWKGFWTHYTTYCASMSPEGSVSVRYPSLSAPHNSHCFERIWAALVLSPVLDYHRMENLRDKRMASVKVFLTGPSSWNQESHKEKSILTVLPSLLHTSQRQSMAYHPHPSHLP